MSDDANISRVSFEEIQEFKGLNLFNIVSTDPNITILLAYDPATRVFSSIELNLTNGLVSIIRQDTLTEDVIINNDDMAVERGYIFYKDQTMTEIMKQLANPLFDAVVDLTIISATGIQKGEDFLVESGRPNVVDFSYILDSKDAGAQDGVEKYYIDNVEVNETGNALNLTVGGAETAEAKISVTTLTNPNFVSSTKTDTVNIKAVYSIYYGVADDTVLPVINTGTLLLEDIKETKEMVLPIGGQTESKYFWFAVHNSEIPVNWVGQYSNGQLQYSNEGSIDSTFDLAGTGIYNGAVYKIFRTKEMTIFEQDLKINF